jgi:hypothetical protein
MVPCAPAEENACHDTEEEDNSRCAKDPFLVRDKGGHVGEPAFVCCGYHGPTRSRSCGIVSGITIIEGRFIRFALGLAVVPRQVVCGLRMCFGRGAGTVGHYWAIGAWDRGERFFK